VGVQEQLHSFLISAVDVGEWSTSRHGRFTYKENPACTLNRGMGGPQRPSGHLGRKENLLPLSGFKPLYGVHCPEMNLIFVVQNRMWLTCCHGNHMPGFLRGYHADKYVRWDEKVYSIAPLGPQRLLCFSVRYLIFIG